MSTNEASVSTPIENIIHYCKTVLGIDRIVVPPLAGATSGLGEGGQEGGLGLEIRGGLNSARLVALVPLFRDEFPLRGEAEALLEKMLRAMKLAPSEVILATWQFSGELTIPDEIAQLAAAAGSRPILVFGGAKAAARLSQGDTPEHSLGQWSVWGESRLLTTFSPRELLSSPDQKRLAWVHLQAVMKHL